MMRYLLLILIAVFLVASPVAAKMFDHDAHWRAYTWKEPCSTCHRPGGSSIVPDREVCLECHDDKDFIAAVEYSGIETHGPLWSLNHGAAARGKNMQAVDGQTVYDCAACHEQKECLACHRAGFADEMGEFSNNMVNVHLSEFNVTHPIAARTDPQRCDTCHNARFCQECHDRFAPEDWAILSHRKGWSSLVVGPSGEAHAEYDETLCQLCHQDSVLPSHEWSAQHGREARKNLATCQACHPQGDVCLRCHSATSGLGINPHPDNWEKVQGRLERASGGRTCIRCH